MQRVPFSPLTTAAGMALLLSLGLFGSFTGCGKSEPAPTAETKKFRPVDDSASPSAGSNNASNSAFNNGISPASAEFPADGSGQSPAATGREIAASGPPGVQISGELKSVLEQLNRLGSQQPKGTTPQEQLEEFVRIQTQRLALSKKALTLNPPIEMKRQIVMAMYEIMQRFVEFRIPSAMQQLVDFSKTMSADPDPEIARTGRHARFSANLTRLAGEQNNPGGINTKEIVAEAAKLLAAEKGNLSEATLQLVGQTADMLTEGGFTADASNLIETIADMLKADPKLADQAPRYALIAKVVKMDLDALMNNVFKDEPGADEKMAAALQSLLTELPPSRDLLNRTQTIAHILEVTGHYKSALTAFDQIAVAFANSSDESLAVQAKEIAPAAKLRIGLVGQPFTVEGVTIDGTPLDWSAYAGKVTLVDFWATWCGPCLEEMPNVRQNFEQFHAKGFEVVGVSMDAKINDLKQFLSLQGSDIPWVSVTSQVVIDNQLANGDWSKLPMAAKCGVQSIPFIVLVGRDGKVDSIHVRGPKLKARLTQLLGEPTPGEIPTDPTQRAAPAAGAPSATRPDGKQSYLPSFPGSPLGTHHHDAPASHPVAPATPFSLLLASALLSADEPTPADETSINPYLPKPGLSTKELAAFIQKMLDRPQAIQTREGFTAGIVAATDSILAAEPPATESEQLLAIQTKLAVLHRDATGGKKSADDQLAVFVEQLKDDSRSAATNEKIAKEIAFFRLERRVLTAKEAPVSEIASMLDAVKEFAAHEKLSAKHLRLASGTVALINRLDSETDREARFAELGELFAQSPDKDLSRYGRKIAKSSATK